MRKFFLSAAAMAAGFATVSAQVPYILTEVADNTYAVTMTQEEIAAKYDAAWCTAAWNIGVALPAGTVMFENDEVTIKAGVDNTPVYTANNKLTQIKEENPGYTGYVNLGSTLSQNNWNGDEQILVLSEFAASNHGIVVVTPKTDGTLKFGVYAGDNSREIGIYKLDEENLEDYGWVSTNNFRNDGENGTVKNAPAYVEGEVKAGRDYALMAGGNKNLNMHQIVFTPSGSAGISGTAQSSEKTAVAYYTLDGARTDAPAKGVSIVKYSDGTTSKIIR